MRLSDRLKNLILSAVDSSFGDVQIYLFGSRVDDSRKGGDIDIALSVDMSKDEFRKKRITFKRYLMQKGYDLKIDLVQWNHKIDDLLYREIENNHQMLHKN